MNQPKVTLVSNLQNPSVHWSPGFSIISIIIVIALIAVAAGLLLPKIVPKRKTPPAFEEVGMGRMEGKLFTNEYFGLSIHVPEGWEVEFEEDRERWLRQSGKDEEEAMATVLVAFEPHRAGPGVVAPMLVIQTKRLSSIPEVKTVEDLMERTLRIRQRKGPQVGEQKKPYHATLGEQACLRFDGRTRYLTGVANDVLLAMLRRGYGLIIWGAWQTEEDRRALMQSLKTVQFK